MKQSNNTVVVITGADSGLGREYALVFPRLGSLAAIPDVNEDVLPDNTAIVHTHIVTYYS